MLRESYMASMCLARSYVMSSPAHQEEEPVARPAVPGWSPEEAWTRLVSVFATDPLERKRPLSTAAR